MNQEAVMKKKPGVLDVFSCGNLSGSSRRISLLISSMFYYFVSFDSWLLSASFPFFPFSLEGLWNERKDQASVRHTTLKLAISRVRGEVRGPTVVWYSRKSKWLSALAPFCFALATCNFVFLFFFCIFLVSYNTAYCRTSVRWDFQWGQITL